MINELLLMSGSDIGFIEAGVIIHQPLLKEIAYIGEESFFTGCELLNFSKDILSAEGKSDLEDRSNFEIFMSIMNDKRKELKEKRTCVLMLLTLMFPNYKYKIHKNRISFSQIDDDVDFEIGSINEKNYEKFKEILVDIFCLKRGSSDDYNPQGEIAKKIAEKLKKRQQKLAELNNTKGEKIAIFSRYTSILSVGLPQDLNTLMNYTVYQLFDILQRYEAKMQYDFYIQAKMAGATELKEVDDWMRDLHP